MTKGTSRIHTGKMLAKSEDIGVVLVKVLQNARDNNRLTCGVYESGVMLEMNPDSVMVCVLPVNKSGDVTLDIHFTLIEAFCLENKVPLIKVDNTDKLQELLGDRPHPAPDVTHGLYDDYAPGDDHYLDTVNAEWSGLSTDYNCLLIEYPADKCSGVDESLLAYHKETCVQVPQPIIALDI